MADYLTDPVSFGAADRWLRQRATLPLGLSSDDIANKIPANTRMQLFFSATMTKASLLEDFRAEVEALFNGETTLAYARERLMAKAAANGYEAPGAGEAGDRDVSKIGSTSRIELILNQNVRMAQAVAQRDVSENEAVVEAFPNYRYHANTDRHARFDGLVLPKSDPFWDTHFPPWEFNCQCFVTDEPGPANAASAAIKQHADGSQSGTLTRDDGVEVAVESSGSGFVFRSNPRELWNDFNTATIADADLRAHVDSTLASARQKWGLGAS